MSNYTASVTIHSDSVFEQARLFAAVGDASQTAIRLPHAWEMAEDENTLLNELIQEIVCKVYSDGKALKLTKQIISDTLDRYMEKEGVEYVVSVLNEMSVAAGALADAIEGKGY